MKIREVAEIAGVSVRTLHYYDHINLLKPDHITEAGYRIYSADNLEALQQILFFRELGFTLKEIKKIMQDPSFNRVEALNMQKKMLLEKSEQLTWMIDTIDRTLRHIKGEIEMTHEEKFIGFDFSHNPYEKEARKQWGDKAVDKSELQIKNNQEKIEKAMNEIYTHLSELRHNDPSSVEVQAAIKKWYDFLNMNFGTYSPEAFKGLGLMYTQDERFTKNIDQFGDGLAQFMSEAMGIFANNSK